MRVLLIIGLLLVLLVGYVLMTQSSVESQVSPDEINAALNDAGNSLLDETNDVTIGDLL